MKGYYAIMEKQYITPEMEITRFEAADIIVTSGTEYTVPPDQTFPVFDP